MKKTPLLSLSKRRAALAFCGVALSLLINLILMRALTFSRTFGSNREPINFDSQSKDSQLSNIKESSVPPSLVKELHAHFDMQPESFSNYPNIFQTADYNAGIRMEIGPSGQAGFILGHVSNGDIKGTGTYQLKLGEWYHVKLDVWNRTTVAIQINGQSMLQEQIPNGLSFDVTHMIVGAGFAKTRPFVGTIRDFQLMYRSTRWGNFLSRLHTVLWVSLLVLLIPFWRSLVLVLAALDPLFNIAPSSDVRRFLVKASLLLLPVTIFLGNIEYHLHVMPNNYSQKRKHLESRLADIQVLVLGSSNAFFGINPRLMIRPGFNVAYRGQALYYDQQIVKRYLPHMPQLKAVVIPIIYLTFGTHQYVVDPPRAYLYQHYWGIRPERRRGHGLDANYWLDAKRFNLISVYAERTYSYFAKGYQETIDPDPDNTGWFDGGNLPCNVALNVGPSAARAHNVTIQTGNFDQNAQLLQDMIDRLKKRNIVPILIQLPLNHVYTDYLDKAQWTRMEDVLHTLAQKNNIQYLDYTFDDRFTLNDFTDMPDHLNARGADKFTRILDAAITRELHSPRKEPV